MGVLAAVEEGASAGEGVGATASAVLPVVSVLEEEEEEIVDVLGRLRRGRRGRRGDAAAAGRDRREEGIWRSMAAVYVLWPGDRGETIGGRRASTKKLVKFAGGASREHREKSSSHTPVGGRLAGSFVGVGAIFRRLLEVGSPTKPRIL